MTDLLILKTDVEEALKSSTIPFAGVAMAPAPEGKQTDDADTWARYRLVNDSVRTIAPEHVRSILANARMLMLDSLSYATQNAAIAGVIFGCGPADAREWCKWAGVDPDSAKAW